MEPRTVINIQETIGKTVGRRRVPKDALVAGLQGLSAANELMKAFGHRLGPKGVFRFNSHEEADAWKMKHLRPNKTI